MIAYTSDLVVESTRYGVTISQAGENWGDPWETPHYTITVKDVTGLIKALQRALQEKQYDDW